MISNNRLDYTFGIGGVVFGIAILMFGIYVCFYSWIGVTTIVVGAFLTFSNSSTKIDFDNKRMKFSNNLFGIFSIGYWIAIKPGMNLHVKDCTKKNKTSVSNKNSVLQNNEFKIFLVNEDGKDILAVKKFSDKVLAEKEIEEFKLKFGM